MSVVLRFESPLDFEGEEVMHIHVCQTLLVLQVAVAHHVAQESAEDHVYFPEVERFRLRIIWVENHAGEAEADEAESILGECMQLLGPLVTVIAIVEPVVLLMPLYVLLEVGNEQIPVDLIRNVHLP